MKADQLKQKKLDELDEDNHAYAIILDKLHKNACKQAHFVPRLKKRLLKFEHKYLQQTEAFTDLKQILEQKTQPT